MTKQELCNKVYDAAQGSLTREQAEKHVATMLRAMSEAIAADDPVTLQGFGSFKSVSYKERQGRNPQTGKPMTIPAGKRVKFVPSKVLVESLK